MTGTNSSQMGPRLVAGRYRLTEVLGRGGMGVVWQAADELIGRTVAVKELRIPHGLSERERAAFGERALREARTAGRIRHPGVIAIHDLIPDTAQDSVVYVVMEFVEAPSLAAVLEQDGALPERRVARLGVRLLEALDAAHAIGLIHRDVKPSNILVLADDEVKLVDFGIAHAVDDTRLTRTGVAGSIGYIAPELFEGESPTPAADLWSVGVTLHHAATGRSPFERGSTAATIRAVLHEDPPPLDRHPSLSPVIEGLLVRDPARRLGGGEAAEGLRSAVTSARNPAPEPVRQAPRPDEATGRPATWQNRPTGVHPRLTSARRPRARADTTGQASATGRDTATGSPRQPGLADRSAAALRHQGEQRNNGGSGPATWADQPTTVRNTAPPRPTARSRAAGWSDDETDGGTERYAISPSQAVRQFRRSSLVVLAGLSWWTGWRLCNDVLQLPFFLVVVVAGCLFFVTQLTVVGSSGLDSFVLDSQGITLLWRKEPWWRLLSPPNGKALVPWNLIDEVVLLPRSPAETTSRDSRTAIALHVSLSKRRPVLGVDRTDDGRGFIWSLGEADHPAAELNVSIRAAAPPQATVRCPSEPNAKDLLHHRPRRLGPVLASLSLAGILAATYVFHHEGGPVQLEKAGWDGEVEFSPDGATLASSSTDHTVKLWDVGTRKNTGVLSGHMGAISAMRFTPDGSLLAAAADDIDEHTISLWDVSTHTERRTLTVGEDTSVVSLAFSPDNHTLASVDEDGTILVWDVRSGRKTATIRENTSDAFPVEFSVTSLFLGGFDSGNRPHRWDVVTGRPVSVAARDGNWATISGSTVSIRDGSGSSRLLLIGHEGKITDMDWSGGTAKLLATGSTDGTIRIWRTDTGKMARKLTLDRDSGSTADAVALSPIGRTLVYGSGTALWIWETGVKP
ncbi:protein kinase [Streptomyces sp. NPDC051677]|uniref:WD40 repeat domain-containing serine/threonine protein kinase n=1 Tax=Streptomyces sp. NPDC051677 TaxID=3365669 RepID=UPI0037CE22F0